MTPVESACTPSAAVGKNRGSHVPRPEARCVVRTGQDRPPQDPKSILANLALRGARIRETRSSSAFARDEGRGRLGGRVHGILLHPPGGGRVSVHLGSHLGRGGRAKPRLHVRRRSCTRQPGRYPTVVQRRQRPVAGIARGWPQPQPMALTVVRDSFRLWL